MLKLSSRLYRVGGVLNKFPKGNQWVFTIELGATKCLNDTRDIRHSDACVHWSPAPRLYRICDGFGGTNSLYTIRSRSLPAPHLKHQVHVTKFSVNHRERVVSEPPRLGVGPIEGVP